MNYLAHINIIRSNHVFFNLDEMIAHVEYIRSHPRELHIEHLE